MSSYTDKRFLIGRLKSRFNFVLIVGNSFIYIEISLVACDMICTFVHLMFESYI